MQVVTFAGSAYSIKPGAKRSVVFSMNRANAALLASVGSTPVVATIVARDSVGNVRTTKSRLTLKPPRR